MILEKTWEYDIMKYNKFKIKSIFSKSGIYCNFVKRNKANIVKMQRISRNIYEWKGNGHKHKQGKRNWKKKYFKEGK